jgi:outer membrane protein assembly factor BamE (lipoprotein component of BamABCDE complex)
MKTLLITIVLATAIFFQGCASTGNKKIMNADFMKSLQIGQTTKESVVALLGEPQHTGSQQGGYNWEIWRYTGTDRSINAASFIPLVDIAAGRQTTTVRVVDLYFDGKGVLTDIKSESDLSERVMPIGTVMLGAAAVGAAAGAAASRPYGYGPGYYGGRGRTVINTIPTGGGGSMTTIKWYK